MALASFALATVNDKGLDDKVSNHFGRARAFTMIDIENGKARNMKVTTNPALSISWDMG